MHPHHRLAAVLFTKPLEEKVAAKEGESLTISCDISKDRARVQWFRNGEKLPSGRMYKTSISGTTRKLTIANVDFEKEAGARFTCRIVENDEPTETTAQIYFPEMREYE